MRGLETNQDIIALRDAIHRWEDGAVQNYQNLMLSEYLPRMGFTITRGDPIYPPVMPESIVLEPNHFEGLTGTFVQLTPIFTPSNTSNKTGIWLSDNMDIAAVPDGDGRVQLKSSGMAKITFVSNANSVVSTECIITVEAN